MKTKKAKATDISTKVKAIVWERDGHCCIICGSPYAMPNSHYIRRSQGGLGIEQNVVTMCQDCHHQYDNGDMRERYQEFVKSYLMSRYENWNGHDLIYNKWKVNHGI